MMRKPFDCPRCGKVFTTQHGAQNHIDDVHRDGSTPRKRPKPQKRDQDPSLAEISIEAHWKQMIGEPLDPLEESLING